MKDKIGPHVDNELYRLVRRQIGRRYEVDTSKVQARVSYGVVYLSGELRAGRAFSGTLKQELETIRNILLHIRGVKEVVDRDLRLVE